MLTQEAPPLAISGADLTDQELLGWWAAKGERLSVPGTADTRIWRDGSGPPVVCLHGVPASAYLYRKVLSELAARGLEGVALDFPGLGFSERPERFDYSWTGLSAWLEQALNAAGIDSFHLVVHDVGGPVGFDLIRRIPDRIASLTVMNTLVRSSEFHKPVVMRPFSVPGLGSLWVKQMNSPMIIVMMRKMGVMPGPTNAELRAYGRLLTRGDGGRGFRKIMSGFELTEEFEQRILEPLARRRFPAQIVWGRHDTELTIDGKGADARAALGLDKPIHAVEGKHFLQENCGPEIADRIATLVETGTDQ
ncbi:MAG: alpha/beta hydrolase [Acidimicrobiales bacterium]